MTEVATDKYFKTGESVTVEAGINGFIVHTEDGPIVTMQVDQMVAAVIQTTTNHIALEAQQKAAAALAEEEEQENVSVDAGVGET